MERQTQQFRFRKSSYSGGGEDQQCVEVDASAGAVQDSKNPGAVVVVGAAALTAFIGAVRADEFAS
jgi:uncharacterized protein DUF397